MNTKAQPPGLQALGLRHVPMVFASPTQLFRRIEDTGAYGWALSVLIVLVSLIGYAEVQTGLIDRVVDEETEQRLADLERSQLHLVDRMEFKEQMEDIRKSGDFEKLITRLGAVVAAPAYILASVLFIASVLYALVALTGRKPEYHTLLSICVHAAFIELVAHALRLGMMLYYRTLDVDTSLGALAGSEATAWLYAVDPFRVWYWVLVALGLTVTRQLSRRMAILSCTLMGMVAMGARAAVEYVL